MADDNPTNQTERSAPELPSRNLPPATYRDLPDSMPLRKALGPGVVMAAIGIGSGEYILNPFIASQVGLVFLWGGMIALLTQYFINTEIERYTLATGETAITGFVRIWKPWAPLFIIMTILPWAWPGWMTSAATLMTFTFGGGNVVLLSVLGLIAIGITLTLSPVVYQTVEKIEFFKVAAVIVFAVVAILFVIEARAWGDLAEGTVEGFGRLPEGIPFAVLLSVLAFTGGGGTVNLTMSNWIRDKGWGMGTHIPRIVSPITGEEEALPSTGYMFPQTEENMSRWREWWRVARIEQFWTFFFVGALSVIMFSVLAYSVLPVGEVEAEDLGFIQVEGEALKDAVGPWFGTFFWLIGAVSLFFANFAIIDMVGRIIADIMKVNYLRDSAFWTESKLYFAMVWIEIAFGSIILLSGLNQPFVLLVTAAVLNGIVTFIYSGMLIRLNRGSLPDAIKVRGFRLFVLGWAVLLFGFFSIVTIIDQVGGLFGG